MIKNILKHKLLLSLVFFSVLSLPGLYAQNIGINTDGTAPDNSAMLHIKSTTTGILIPNVSLTGLTAAAPITAPAHSLLVYNLTVDAGLGLSEGYYYNEGTSGSPSWKAILNKEKAWLTTGNTATTPGTDFLGTTDIRDFIIKTNSTERMSFDKNGGTTASTVKITSLTDAYSGLEINANSLTSGSALSLISTSNGGTADYGRMLFIQRSGANDGDDYINIGILADISNTGTGSQNIGGLFAVSNGITSQGINASVIGLLGAYEQTAYGGSFYVNANSNTDANSKYYGLQVANTGSCASKYGLDLSLSGGTVVNRGISVAVSSIGSTEPSYGIESHVTGDDGGTLATRNIAGYFDNGITSSRNGWNFGMYSQTTGTTATGNNCAGWFSATGAATGKNYAIIVPHYNTASGQIWGGWVGIGCEDPKRLLQVDGTTRIGGEHNFGRLEFVRPGGSAHPTVFIAGNNAATIRYVLPDAIGDDTYVLQMDKISSDSAQLSWVLPATSAITASCAVNYMVPRMDGTSNNSLKCSQIWDNEVSTAIGSTSPSVVTRFTILSDKNYTTSQYISHTAAYTTADPQSNCLRLENAATTTLGSTTNIGETITVTKGTSSSTGLYVSVDADGTGVATGSSCGGNFIAGGYNGLNYCVKASSTSSTGTVYGIHSALSGGATKNVAGYFAATNGTTRYALITEGGNVGIGTVNPDNLLHVAGIAQLGTPFDSPNPVTGVLKFYNSGQTKYTALQANPTSNKTYTLPPTVPASDGQVLSSTTAGVMSWATAGTVTSVGLTMPGQYNVSNSPITGSNTFDVQWNAQAANKVFAGPPSGGNNFPTFRALVAADMPSHTHTFDQIGTGTNTTATMTVGNGASIVPSETGVVTANKFITSASTSDNVDLATTEVNGTLPIANGGTNGTATPTAGAVAYGNAAGTAYAFTAAGTTGQVLTSAGAGTPVWVTPGAAQKDITGPITQTYANSGKAAGLQNGVSTITLSANTSGKVLVTISGSVANSVASRATQLQIFYGTGTGPALAGTVGTLVGGVAEAYVNTAGTYYPFSLSVVITGLTASQAYYFDLKTTAPGASGSQLIKNVSISVIEL